MSATVDSYVIKCEAKCEGGCVCNQPNSLLMTYLQGTQENLPIEAPTEPMAFPPINTADSAATGINNGGTSVLRNRYKKLEEDDTRCLCHEKPKPTDRKARNKLIAACVIVFFFMIGEIVGEMTCFITLNCTYCRVIDSISYGPQDILSMVALNGKIYNHSKG